MLFEDKTSGIIAACMEVHKQLGNGFLEAVYAEALEQEFRLRKIPFVREKAFRIDYKGVHLNKIYRVDYCCYDLVIIELKAIDDLYPIHISQLVNYLKISNYPVGLLFNFGNTSLQYKRRDNLGSTLTPQSF
ncbi:MAG TPA: GxxExxY protein [Candidatus Cloacimonadota bacterium]|nr:GxxExxY protein [Candidatus Cloacimonadota bacterium]HPS40070.1 GxxExxY protein [Candidatus Cloacimonadota bacterium]